MRAPIKFVGEPCNAGTAETSKIKVLRLALFENDQLSKDKLLALEMTVSSGSPVVRIAPYPIFSRLESGWKVMLERLVEPENAYCPAPRTLMLGPTTTSLRLGESLKER